MLAINRLCAPGSELAVEEVNLCHTAHKGVVKNTFYEVPHLRGGGFLTIIVLTKDQQLNVRRGHFAEYLLAESRKDFIVEITAEVPRILAITHHYLSVITFREFSHGAVGCDSWPSRSRIMAADPGLAGLSFSSKSSFGTGCQASEICADSFEEIDSEHQLIGLFEGVSQRIESALGSACRRVNLSSIAVSPFWASANL